MMVPGGSILLVCHLWLRRLGLYHKSSQMICFMTVSVQASRLVAWADERL